MRVAVMIIALCLTMILGVQSCAVTAGGALLGDEGTQGAGGMGLLLAVIFVVGAAFTWGFPRFAGTLFLAGGVLALLVSAGTPFVDLVIWGCVSIGLAIMAFIGSRELRRPMPPPMPYQQMPPYPVQHQQGRWIERQPEPLLLPAPEGMQPYAPPPYLPPDPARRRRNQLIATGVVTAVLIGVSLGAFTTGGSLFDTSSGGSAKAGSDAKASRDGADTTASASRASGTVNSGDSNSAAPGAQASSIGTTEASADRLGVAEHTLKTVPAAFRGRWDDDVSDGCDAREATLTITTQGDALYEYEVESTVMNVVRQSPTETVVSVAGYSDEGPRFEASYRLKLGPRGQTLQVDENAPLRKCPN